MFFDEKKAGNCDGSNMIRSILSSTDTKGTPSSLLEQSDLFIICNQKRCEDEKGAADVSRDSSVKKI